jgi:hypothetical protein
MNSPIPSPAAAREMMRGALGQIDFARKYTLELLEMTPPEHWFRIPAGFPSNVAWQVGHITVSQYGLLMFRIRGRRPEDLDLIPGKFRKAYGRGSVPKSDETSQPAPAELLERMAKVYELAKAELAQVAPQTLLESIDLPYAAYPNKLGAILFCPLHEQIHAGQIGLLRRGLSLDPIR